MAKYNRDFLIPYLENVCALYMADNKLVKIIQGIHYRINDCSTERKVWMPIEPKLQENSSKFLLGIGYFFLFSAALFIFALMTGEIWGGLAYFFIITALGMGIYFVSHELAIRNEDKEEYNRAKREYEVALANYNASIHDIQAYNTGLRAQIPALRAEIQYYENERNKIYQLINQAYQANVIPFQYRDMYAAVYFYNYFSTSGANDLDMAINTYVLEQIKQKLDTIIEQQSEMILNQRIMVAYQQQTLEEQRAHATRMEQYARQIATSVEEQNQYLSMVEANTAATAYFAAAQYFR